MRIGIVGSGAVGLYYGARLQRSGQDIRFLLRGDYAAILRSGIRVRASDTSFQIKDVSGYRNSSEIGEVDLVIVSVKSTSNSELPRLLKPLIKTRTIILTLQNGLGNYEFLRSAFPGNPVLVGACFVCLNRVGPGVVENHYLGSVVLGGDEEEAPMVAPSIAQVLESARIRCRVGQDPHQLLWEKLLWNVPFNGLAIAAGEISTDLILSSEALSGLARGLMEEIVQGAESQGLRIEGELIERLMKETRSMGSYRPSSLVDFVDGKPVELESIWGEPLRRAMSAGVELPKLETLYRLLKILCVSNEWVRAKRAIEGSPALADPLSRECL
jgi:2-dehydropantoate 2-reductase